MLLCTHMVAHDGLADRFESALLQIGVASRNKRALASAAAQQTAKSCFYERGTLKSINHFLLICPLSAPSFAAYDYIRSQLSARFGGSLDLALKSRKSWFHETTLLSHFRGEGVHNVSEITLADVIQGTEEMEGFDGEDTDDLALLIPQLEAELRPSQLLIDAKIINSNQDRALAESKREAATLAEKLLQPGAGSLQRQDPSVTAVPTLRPWLVSSPQAPSKVSSRSTASPASADNTAAAATSPPPTEPKRRHTHLGRLNALRKRWETALPLLKLAREGKGKQIEKLCEILAVTHDREVSHSTAAASATSSSASSNGRSRSRPLTDLLAAAAHNPEARKNAAQALRLYSRKKGTSSGSSHPSTRSKTTIPTPSKVELEEALDSLEEELAGSFGCENLKHAVWVAECEVRAEEWREAERKMRVVEEEMSAQEREREEERERSWKNAAGWWWRRARL